MIVFLRQKHFDARRAVGKVAGEIIAFMNQGGVQFAAVGRVLYDLARAKGLGTAAPLEWFHQNKSYVP